MYGTGHSAVSVYNKKYITEIRYTFGTAAFMLSSNHSLRGVYHAMCTFPKDNSIYTILYAHQEHFRFLKCKLLQFSVHLYAIRENHVENVSSGWSVRTEKSHDQKTLTLVIILMYNFMKLVLVNL